MKPLLQFAVRIIIALLSFGILASVLVYFLQDKMIFYPQKISPRELETASKYPNVREVSLKAGDGTSIEGWHIANNVKNARTKVLFYFGGNAEEVSHNIPRFLSFKDCSVVLFNFRGYGRSQGSPSEENMYRDALEIYDRFVPQNSGDSVKVIIMGRSIGTGVAVYLARNRRTDGVILVSPYHDFKTLAKIHFPYLPAKLLVKYGFNSAERAPFIKAPLLEIIGANDRTIPPDQSRLLAQKWGGKVIIREFAGADHNNLSACDEYWKTINDFIGSI